MLVDDEARQGTLRFAEREGGPFLREEGIKRIPPLIELPKLLSAAEHVMEEKDTEEELGLLFAPGSSLGGARPKASVRIGQRNALGFHELYQSFAVTADIALHFGHGWKIFAFGLVDVLSRDLRSSLCALDVCRE